MNRIVLFAFAILTISCVPQNSNVTQMPNDEKNNFSSGQCKEIKQVKVSGKEFIHEGERYLKVKNRLVDQLLLDAVSQTIGLEIKRLSQLTINANSERGEVKLTDEFKEITIDKARGYINSYYIPEQSESIKNVRDLPVLELALVADVCVPDTYRLPDIVMIGAFKFENYDIEGVNEFVSSLFLNNPRYQLAEGSPKTTYYDWLITGKLLNANAIYQKNYGRSIINGILGGIALNGKPLSVDPHVIHVNITSYMQAKSSIDNRIISQSATLTKELPVSLSKKGIANNIDMLVMESIKEASLKLFNKMMAEQTNR